MPDPNPNEAAAALHTGFGATPVTVSVNPASARDPGFADLNGSAALIPTAAPMVNAGANTSKPEDPDLSKDARVAALLPMELTIDRNAVRAFMANVVAWPAPETPGTGYINLHYSMLDQKDPTKLFKGMGWPFTTVDTFVQRAAWISNNHATLRDVWFCTSTQSKAGTNKKGNPKAVRLSGNATFQKSIWIDLDVKDPAHPEPSKDAKKYDTTADAVKAALGFAKVVGLPNPSAIVYSGNGVHFYWISKTPLTPAEWQPFASGLKNLLLANNIMCDAAITTDIARILRVPGTFNHKDLANPKPVQLAAMPLKMYDFTTDLDFLP